MPRPIFVVANWKMHTRPSESRRLAISIVNITGDASVRVIICPPFLSLPVVHDALAGSDVELGAQNVHWEADGPYTGEISAPMIAEYATWCLVGHSERRRDQGETDALIGQKLARCRENQIQPILFVGETAAERMRGETEPVVRHQLRAALASLAATGRPRVASWLVVAYEPVWAVGSDDGPSAVEAGAIARSIRGALRDLGLTRAGEDIPVLYGGSVDAASAAGFLGQPEFDGVVLGRASLDAQEMATVIRKASGGVRSPEAGV